MHAGVHRGVFGVGGCVQGYVASACKERWVQVGAFGWPSPCILPLAWAWVRTSQLRPTHAVVTHTWEPRAEQFVNSLLSVSFSFVLFAIIIIFKSYFFSYVFSLFVVAFLSKPKLFHHSKIRVGSGWSTQFLDSSPTGRNVQGSQGYGLFASSNQKARSSKCLLCRFRVFCDSSNRRLSKTALPEWHRRLPPNRKQAKGPSPWIRQKHLYSG